MKYLISFKYSDGSIEEKWLDEKEVAEMLSHFDDTEWDMFFENYRISINVNKPSIKLIKSVTK